MPQSLIVFEVASLLEKPSVELRILLKNRNFKFMFCILTAFVCRYLNFKLQNYIDIKIKKMIFEISGCRTLVRHIICPIEYRPVTISVQYN